VHSRIGPIEEDDVPDYITRFKSSTTIQRFHSAATSPLRRCWSALSRLGLRSRREIDAERFALKALRGDFQSLPDIIEARGTAPVVEAVRR